MISSHDNRRHELDMHRHEIDELKQALNEQATSLQQVSREKERLSAEKNDVARTVSSLENDLKRVKQDAEAFGRDLKLLRQEKGIYHPCNKKNFILNLALVPLTSQKMVYPLNLLHRRPGPVRRSRQIYNPSIPTLRSLSMNGKPRKRNC